MVVSGISFDITVLTHFAASQSQDHTHQGMCSSGWCPTGPERQETTTVKRPLHQWRFDASASQSSFFTISPLSIMVASIKTVKFIFTFFVPIKKNVQQKASPSSSNQITISKPTFLWCRGAAGSSGQGGLLEPHLVWPVTGGSQDHEGMPSTTIRLMEGRQNSHQKSFRHFNKFITCHYSDPMWSDH